MQLNLLHDSDMDLPVTPSTKRSGAFTDNMKLPVHRWFRYSAGFSAEWVEGEVSCRAKDGRLNVLDPFCGSGTTLLAAAMRGADATGFETHPFVARIARAKTQIVEDVGGFEARAALLLRNAAERQQTEPSTASPLLLKCYDSNRLAQLESLREAYSAMISDPDPTDELIWLAITSVLRECSGVGTAQWQYVLPNKTKARVSEPFAAFRHKINQMCQDLLVVKAKKNGAIVVKETDARSPEHQGRFDLVLTSPPYPNNYDYADATRLEMTFWGEIQGWGDLQGAVRQYLIRACSQHSAAERLVLDDLLQDNTVGSIREELTAVCRELDLVRQQKGGKKTYHTMVAAYFADLGKVWKALRELVRDGGGGRIRNW